MDSKVDLTKFGFEPGAHVVLADDDWGASNDVILVDAEPVPGSSQCVVSVGGEIRTVSRSELRAL